jgi:hypothetical protein
MNRVPHRSGQVHALLASSLRLRAGKHEHAESRIMTGSR